MSNEVSTTPKSAVPAKKPAPTIRQLIEGPQFRSAVDQSLPKHLTSERFVRVAITAMTKNPKLAECDQASFFNALMNLSQLGLEPDGRRAHLIPFENRQRGIIECQLIVDYKGLVELAMRSGTVANIHADKVCDTDEFEFDRGELKKHKIDFRNPRGRAFAFYALCRFKDGSEKCEVMTHEEVESIRSRSRAGTRGPWVTDFDEMAKKTVFRRLSKWLPLSPEFRDALDADADAVDVTPAKPAAPHFDLPPMKEIAPPANDAPKDDDQIPGAEAPARAPRAKSALSFTKDAANQSPAQEASPATPPASTITPEEYVSELKSLLEHAQIPEDSFLRWASKNKYAVGIEKIEEMAEVCPSKLPKLIVGFDNIKEDVRKCVA